MKLVGRQLDQSYGEVRTIASSINLDTWNCCLLVLSYEIATELG